jgi:hypothetical protein
MPTTDSNNANRSSQATRTTTNSNAGSSWMTRIANVMRPNFGRDTSNRRGGSRITKLIFGTLLFVLVGQLLVTGLTILDSVYKLGLQAPVFSGAPWLSWFFLIYFVLLIGLWILLNYLGFFPKPEPLPPAGSRKASSSNGSGAGKNVTQIPGIGGPRARPRAPTPPPPAPAPVNVRKGLLALLPKASKAATTVATKTTKATTAQEPTNRAYDAAYERARAARRQKRRRSGR